MGYKRLHGQRGHYYRKKALNRAKERLHLANREYQRAKDIDRLILLISNAALESLSDQQKAVAQPHIQNKSNSLINLLDMNNIIIIESSIKDAENILANTPKTLP